MNKGLYIAFEGGEGCGKTVQQKILAQRLEKMFPGKVRCTREPGGETEAAKMLREFLLNKQFKEGLNPKAEFLIFSAQRAQELPITVKYAVDNGLILLSDRSSMSRVYQAEGRGLDWEQVNMINKFAVGDIVPDLTLLFDVSPKVGLGRKKDGQEWNRFEAESLEFHNRIRKAYLKLAEEDKAKIRVINGELTIEDISWRVWQEVELLICNYGIEFENGRGKER